MADNSGLLPLVLIGAGAILFLWPKAPKEEEKLPPDGEPLPPPPEAKVEILSLTIS